MYFKFKKEAVAAVVQLLSCCRPQGLQLTRLPCPSPSPGVCSNSCPLSRWCHLTILSSVTPFSSCSQSFSASESFPMSQLFASNKLLKIFNKYMSEEPPIPFFFSSLFLTPQSSSLVAQMVKSLSAMGRHGFRSLGWKDSVEKGMASYSSILAWRIPGTEQAGGL